MIQMIIFQNRMNIQEDYLLPKIHHAALPQAVVADDVNLVENWVEGLKTYKN